MRNKVAKAFRKMATAEMAMDRAPDRDLVEHPNRSSVINTPKSVRAMYLKLKAAYKHLRSSSTPSKQIVVRERKGSPFTRPIDVLAGPARVQSPLKFLIKHFNPYDSIVIRAKHAAKHGDGSTVQRLAMAHA